MSEEESMESPSNGQSNQAYWRANLRLMGWLLAIWFVVSFGCGILFVEQLNELTCSGMGSICVSIGSIFLFGSLITGFFKSEKDAFARASASLIPAIWAIAFILLAVYFNAKGAEPFKLGGFKLGFWFAQQGSIYAFVVLIFVYVKKMNQLDHEFGVEED
tara:strand:+ start:7192 stop:7671 length:480 start_codon:yes stop_codon:yes gene_type:complete